MKNLIRSLASILAKIMPPMPTDAEFFFSGRPRIK